MCSDTSGRGEHSTRSASRRLWAPKIEMGPPSDLAPRADRFQFGFELLAIAAVKVGEDDHLRTICGTPGDRAVCWQASERHLLRCGARAGLAFFASIAPPRRTGSQQL